MWKQVSLLLCCAASLCGGNLIQNGDFAETGADGAPANWKIWPAKLHPAAEVAVDSTISMSGGRSLRITQNRPDLYSRVDQLKIPCKPHTRYVASCYVRGLDIHTANRGGARMFIGPHGDLMRAITSFGPGIEQFKRQVPDYWTFDWTRYESEVFNSGDSRELGVTLYLSNASGTVWYDNVEIMEYTPNLQKEREAAVARQLIVRDLDAIRPLLPEAKERLDRLEASLKSFVPEGVDRRAGMPLYPPQRELGVIVGEALQKRLPGDALRISAVADPLAPQGAFLSPGAPAEKILLEGLRGESEVFALNLTNCSGKALTAEIRVEALPGLTLRLATHVETDRRTVVDDALPLLRPDADGVRRVTVPAGMTRQLYGTLTLDRPLAGALIVDGKTLAVECRPSAAALPAELPLTLFSYALPYHNQKLATRFEASQKMLGAMHDNAAHFYQFDSPQPVFDAAGTLLPEKMDWSKTDRHLAMMKQPARALLYLPVYSDPHTSEFLGKADGKPIATFSPEWERRIIAYLRAVVPGFQARGIGYDRLWIIMRDEPAEKDIAYLEKLAAVIRKADPKLKIYNNFHYSLSEKSIRRLAAAIDIIAPELEYLNERNIGIIRDAGKELQCYHVQNRNYPANTMRDNFRKFSRAGLTGFSYWCFFDRHPEWAPTGAQSYSIVYDGDPEEWIPSKRSEAIRDGMEDFTLLELLKRKNPAAYRELMTQEPTLPRPELRHQALQQL